MSNKKKIVIIALLAVAALIAWKAGLFAKLTGSENGSSKKKSTAPDALADIIALTSLTDREKKICLNWAKDIAKWAKDPDSTKWTVASVQKRADDNGITYNQQLVLSALWQMHYTDHLFDVPYFDSIKAEIYAM